MQIKAPGSKIIHCPKCQSDDLRYSDQARPIDLIKWLQKKHALRCKQCGERFHEITDEAANSMWVG